MTGWVSTFGADIMSSVSALAWSHTPGTNGPPSERWQHEYGIVEYHVDVSKAPEFRGRKGFYSIIMSYTMREALLIRSTPGPNNICSMEFLKDGTFNTPSGGVPFVQA